MYLQSQQQAELFANEKEQFVALNPHTDPITLTAIASHPLVDRNALRRIVINKYTDPATLAAIVNNPKIDRDILYNAANHHNINAATLLAIANHRKVNDFILCDVANNPNVDTVTLTAIIFLPIGTSDSSAATMRDVSTETLSAVACNPKTNLATLNAIILHRNTTNYVLYLVAENPNADVNLLLSILEKPETINKIDTEVLLSIVKHAQGNEHLLNLVEQHPLAIADAEILAAVVIARTWSNTTEPDIEAAPSATW
jgi:hypothetical protein